MSDRRADHLGGFTLFEVLAAALILVLVGTVAIGSMNADLSRMGDARRRLEAGRLADRALADLEATLFDGSAPELQNEEEEIDGFLVQKLVAPFGLLFAEEDGTAGKAAPGEEPAPGFFPQLAEEFPGLPQNMRLLQVKVQWGNPMRPESVQRTSLAFDQQTALEAVQNLGQGQDQSDSSQGDDT
jgi:HAMP domain-containing protein